MQNASNANNANDNELDPEVSKIFAQEAETERLKIARETETARRQKEQKLLDDKVPVEFKVIVDHLERWTEQLKSQGKHALLKRSDTSATFTFGANNITIEQCFDNKLNNGTNPVIKIEFQVVMYLRERIGGGFEWKCKDHHFGHQFDGDSRRVAQAILDAARGLSR